MGGGRESKSSGSSHREEKGGSFSDGSKGSRTAQRLGEHPYPMLSGYRKVDGRWKTWGKFPTEYTLDTAVHIQTMKTDTGTQKEREDKACHR